MEKKIAYEPHPVSEERKAELRAQGYIIIDAQFAPAGDAPTEAQEEESGSDADSEAGATQGDDKDMLIAELAKRGIHRDRRTSADKLRAELTKVQTA